MGKASNFDRRVWRPRQRQDDEKHIGRTVSERAGDNILTYSETWRGGNWQGRGRKVGVALADFRTDDECWDKPKYGIREPRVHQSKAKKIFSCNESCFFGIQIQGVKKGAGDPDLGS